jgi:hypothetical protein
MPGGGLDSAAELAELAVLAELQGTGGCRRGGTGPDTEAGWERPDCPQVSRV